MSDPRGAIPKLKKLAVKRIKGGGEIEIQLGDKENLVWVIWETVNCTVTAEYAYQMKKGFKGRMEQVNELRRGEQGEKEKEEE
jgi:hypothetical protein